RIRAADSVCLFFTTMHSKFGAEIGSPKAAGDRFPVSAAAISTYRGVQRFVKESASADPSRFSWFLSMLRLAIGASQSPFHGPRANACVPPAHLLTLRERSCPAKVKPLL